VASLRRVCSSNWLSAPVTEHLRPRSTRTQPRLTAVACPGRAPAHSGLIRSGDFEDHFEIAGSSKEPREESYTKLTTEGRPNQRDLRQRPERRFTGSRGFMGLSKPHPKVVGLAVVGLILSSVIPISTLAPVIAQGSAGSTVVSTDLTNGNDYSSPFSEPTPLTLGPTSSGSITLNPENPGQKIDGFGATLTGSAAADLMSLPSGTLEQVMNKLFGPTGADISLIRVPMGASDFSAIGDYTYDDPPSSDSATQKAAYSDLALTNFSIAPDMNNVIPILKMAEAINPSLQIIATPWTAPPWMKTNGGKSSLYVNTNSLEYTPAIYTNKGGTLKATKAILRGVLEVLRGLHQGLRGPGGRRQLCHTAE